MPSLKPYLRNLSLKHKFSGMFIINSAVLLAAGFLCFFICSRAYEQLLYRTIARNLSYSSGTISSTMRNIETLSTMILSDSSIQDSLSTIKGTGDPILRYNAEQALNSSLFSYYDSFRSSGISYIAIQNQKSAACTNWYRFNRTDPEFLSQVFKTARSAGGAPKWIWESGNREGLFLARDIRQIKNFSLDSIGELIINVNMDELVSLANTPDTSYDTAYYLIVNEEDSVIYASGGIEPDEANAVSRLKDLDYGPVSLGGHSYFAVRGTIPNYHWNYISLVPFDTITRSLDLSFLVVALILTVGTGAVVLLSRLFIRSIIRHFDSLNYKMAVFSKNELVIPESDYPYQERQDEIGKLHQQLDLMMHRVQSLVNTNYVNEILKRNAQLKALEAQINPHFLYNTLDSINWRAKACGNEKISQMAEALGSLLRATLGTKESLVPLSYELDLANSYIAIQKLRFEDELEYELSVDPGLKKALIPPLTIQPLIENAIHYGMEDMDDVCHVFVAIYREQDHLVVKVQNDGSVMDEELLDKLKRREMQLNGFGIGLLNINQRIQILFGEEYGLAFSNEEGYATATLTIAYKTEV